MSSSNVYTPDRYDERVFHLALGVEPRDAISQQRLTSSVDVRVEEFPTPVDRWRRWLPGETLTAALPHMQRHQSGRFVRRYDQQAATTAVLRLVDDRLAGRLRVAGQGRTIVPRRVRVTLSDRDDVVAADVDPLAPRVPIWQRTFPLGCFPGSTAPLASRLTVLRGRIVRTVDGIDVPVRWARVRAENLGGHDVGWAHGDDRGEFVLVLERSDNDIAVPIDPVPVVITVGAVVPAPTPDPADPLRSTIDPLWDLPVEDIVASDTPAAEPTINGRRFLPGQTSAAPITNNPIDLPHGRETSAVFRIN